MRARLLAPLASLVLVAGCGSPTAEDPMNEPRPTLGEPITAAANTWTWVDFPDAVCDEGTPTGIGVNKGTSDNVIVFFMGGGACWDWTTCFAVSFSVHGPYTNSQFQGDKGGLRSGIFNRGDSSNPYRDFNFVFVPYCTSDVHAGDNDATYTSTMGETKLMHHRGRANFRSFIKRIAGTFPNAPKVVISGSSAGGYGAAFNYPEARRYYPDAKVYLVDDSGPPLIGDEIPASFRAAWYDHWGLAGALDATCPDCRNDLSLVIPTYAARYPNDRLALLETLQDQTISGYLLRPPVTFEGDLYDLAALRLDPTPDFRYFFVEGDRHTMLFDLKNFESASGQPVIDWLAQQVNDDPNWKSTAPPQSN